MALYFDSGEVFWKLCQIDSPSELWEVIDGLLISHPVYACGRSPWEALQNASAIALYGAGKFSEAVVASWEKQGIRPIYCVDSDEKKWGGFVGNVQVLNPAVLLENDNPPLVVVAAMSTNEIEVILDKSGIPYLYAERDGSVGYFSGHYLSRHRLEFDRVYRALADDESRRVMLAVAKARIFQCYSFPMRGNYFSSEVASYPQYFVEDIFNFYEDEFFVDCGAFDGDTLISFAAQMQRLQLSGWNAVAFESDRKNVISIRENLTRYGLNFINVICAAVGAGDHVASSLSYFNCRQDNEDCMVQAVTLDKALLGLQPTFIKMDVEGYEVDALAGAIKTIDTFSPKLAICSYHTTRQLLDVPLFILDNFSDYRLFMRHHSSGTLWETVCYGVSENDIS